MVIQVSRRSTNANVSSSFSQTQRQRNSDRRCDDSYRPAWSDGRVLRGTTTKLRTVVAFFKTPQYEIGPQIIRHASRSAAMQAAVNNLGDRER